jgi:hypothetical protein
MGMESHQTIYDQGRRKRMGESGWLCFTNDQTVEEDGWGHKMNAKHRPERRPRSGRGGRGSEALHGGSESRKHFTEGRRHFTARDQNILNEIDLNAKYFDLSTYPCKIF